jgi:hypothetical protein
MPNNIPYDLYALDCYSLTYHTLARFKQIVRHDCTLPPDIIDQIEDNLIPALEYIEGWEPSDADIQAHIELHGIL